MASLDSLPGDQRAVLQLVLGRGRSYAEIARLLSINPTAVRERAVAALDALGPQTKVDPEHRASIADYLLGQLPEAEVHGVRARLAGSASERAWARVISSELVPLASGPLPEIPVRATSIPTQRPPLRRPLPPSRRCSPRQSFTIPARGAALQAATIQATASRLQSPPHVAAGVAGTVTRPLPTRRLRMPARVPAPARLAAPGSEEWC
jgi:hypothetical protein